MVAQTKVDKLKAFLRLRGLINNGRKQELVAGVLVAIENNMKVLSTAQQVEESLSYEYHEQLQTCEGAIIPDPVQLHKGWLDEDVENKHWPSTTYSEIFNFLLFHPAELASKDLHEYKTPKSYSYYSDRWLKGYSTMKSRRKLNITL